MKARRPNRRGQILVLFVFVLIGMFAMAVLAIDVTNVYAARRAYRTAADAAALAGGQELQRVGSRTVTGAEYGNARTAAAAALASQLNGAATCSTIGVTASCTFAGKPLVASIRTPINAGECVSCDPARSVEVKLGNPNFGLSFTHALEAFNIRAASSFNVSVGSVAGLSFAKSYAVITLRPPKKIGSTFDVNDIVLAGGSQITVSKGDVGSNANMFYSNTGGPTPSKMFLEPGYRFFYYPAPPPDNDPGWVPPFPPDPIGVAHTQAITDPNYTYPAMAGVLGTSACIPGPGSNCAPTYTDARASDWSTLPGVDRADNPDGLCAAEAAKLDATAYPFMTTTTPDHIYCYSPGIYQSGSGSANANITVASTDVGLLLPGAYYLKSGMTVNGRLIGGYEPNRPGVALMFDEVGPGNNNQNVLSANSALTFSLNTGSRLRLPATGGTPATAAIDWNNQPVQTSGPNGPTPPVLMTLLVKKDTNGPGGSQGCTVPTSGTFIEPNACDASKDKTINMAGGGSLFLQGVQYMPTDNVTINGGSSGTGIVGQIISWTLTYTGGTIIDQEGAPNENLGVLRLDGACTAPGTPCSP